MPTINASLADVGVTPSMLADCADLDEEWAAIKRAYFKKVLKTPPDKGGDPAVFRKTQSAFESLRSLYDGASPGFYFASCGDQTAGAAAASVGGPAMDTPSWEFYAEAAAEAVPLYRVERAKSGRSLCKAQGSARHCGAEECIAKARTLPRDSSAESTVAEELPAAPPAL